MIVNKSKAPYYDDYDAEKNYHEILFRPRFAVQTRELNQIQSMFNKQIERFGNHIFSEGSMVIPGETNYDLNYDYVKVEVQNLVNIASQLVDNKIELRSSTNGITATMVQFAQPEDSDPATFYVHYVKGGTNKEQNLFTENESIDIINENDNTIGTATVLETGVGSKFTVARGVYYLGGRFVLVDSQTILLGKYSDTPTKVVGFEYNEKIITSNDDETLFDNAQGSPNFTAPGAHRMFIDTELKSYDNLDAAPENFVEIFRIENGGLQKKARGADYNILDESLARRTYDESGNYKVEGFSVDIREHLKEDGNRGVYEAADGGDTDKFVSEIGNGLAYVKGFESQVLSTQRLEMDKARTTDVDNNYSVSAQLGYYITVDSITNIPNVNSFEVVDLKDGVGSVIGSGRIKSIAANGSQYNLYLFDIRDANDDVSTSFITDVRSITGSGAVAFEATVLEDDAVLKGTDNTKLYFYLGYDYIKSLIDADTQVSDTSFTVIKQYDTFVNTSGEVILSSPSNATFLAQNSSYSYASFTDTTNEIVDFSTSYTLGGTPLGNEITIDLGGSNSGRAVRLNIVMSIDEAVTKIKTVSNAQLQATPSNGVLSLSKADVFELVNVTDNDGGNVTNLFTLNKNVRPSYYGVSFITTSETFSDPVTVEFKYFNHGSGDYFCVDSYTGVSYGDIPVEDGVRMTDVIDFRPRINDAGTGFIGAGSNVVDLPAPNTVIRSDIEYYVPRKDVIYIKPNGKIGVIKGNPNIDPEYPSAPTGSMPLYNIDIPAYTDDIDEIGINESSTKRYTMSDISVLEDRIDDLEYYVSLSLLEKDAADMQVVDPITGLNRFKNGFLVDSFVDHSVGDYAWPEYHCAVGDEELRPEMRFNAVDFHALENESSNIKIMNGIATVDFTEASYLKQNLRSTYMNVNPYAVFRWEGEIDLNPSVDNWVDVVYTRPRIIRRTVTRTRRVTRPSQTWQNNATVLSSSSSTSVREISPHAQFVNPVATNFGATTTASRTTTTTTTRNLQNTSSRTSSRSGGTRVVDNEWLPFMRSREVEVTGEGHKPETKLHFFFDDNNINGYIKPNDNSDYGDDVVTDESGNFTCIFRVPNDDNLRIPVGTKLFVASDNDEGRRELSLSYGDTEYTATSRRETRQRTIVRTRVRTIERATVTSTNSNTTTWWDPLAQSFLVEEDGGVFLTKLNLFFLSKDQRAPVHVDIREMENGMPTQRIVEGSRTLLMPSQVIESEDGSVPSTFTFKHPVYLEEGREYCFMIWSNSINYNIFIARLGDNDMASNKAIAKQPYMGVMFKSQNSSTWTADQEADIQFELFRAVFDTSSPGQLKLANSDLPKVSYNSQIMESVSGSNEIILHLDEHNFIVGSTLTIKGAEASNGFSETELNGDHEVTEVIDMNTIKITLPSNATSSGYFGGSNIEMSDMCIASFFNLNCNDVRYNDTNIEYKATGTTGKSFSGDEVPYQSILVPKIIEKGGMHSLDRPWLITNKVDEQTNLEGGNSMNITATMSTSNSNVSPVIDLYTFNLICPYYLVDGNIDTREGDGGNAYAKYRTRITGLNNPANAIKAYIDTVYDNSSDVVLSCRLGNSEEEVLDSDWIVMNNASGVGNTNDKVVEVEYSLENDVVSEYTYYQVMIQIKSKSATRVPICRGLRVLALGT